MTADDRVLNDAIRAQARELERTGFYKEPHNRKAGRSKAKKAVRHRTKRRYEKAVLRQWVVG